MIDYRNPYTPDAGVMPKYLAGRDNILERSSSQIKALTANYPSRSIVLYGLRGTGKTVLLNAIESIADNEGVLVHHIEIEEKRSLLVPLASRCRSLSTSLARSIEVNEGSPSLKFYEEAPKASLTSTQDLSDDFTDLLITLGKLAQIARMQVLFGVDELQYVGGDELSSFAYALHRVTQLGLPIMFCCAGLPNLLQMLGEAKTYSERQFDFVKIGPLPHDSAVDAIVRPAQKLNVSYSDEALNAIIEYSEGYPYFIQEICSTVWASSDSKCISLETVLGCRPLSNKRLDEHFFSRHHDRCTQKQKQFLSAMAHCPELPCTLADVADYMGRKVPSIMPLRNRLIGKGVIYSRDGGKVDFTVPQFGRYLKRVERLGL